MTWGRGPGTGVTASREHLSNLRALLVLTMLMTASDDRDQIIRLAMSSVTSFGNVQPRGIYTAEGGRTAAGGPPTVPKGALEMQLRAVGIGGGRIAIPGDAWAWAFSLGGDARGGFLIAGGAAEPSSETVSYLQVLAVQTGMALANAVERESERAIAGKLSALNESLEVTLAALRRSMEIHDRLTQVAVRAEGQEGLALAIHELTGFPVAIEDRYGNLRAWAGPARPEPYPRFPDAERERLLRRLIREARPLRDRGRLIALARPRGDLLGLVALIDPQGTAGSHDSVAIEHGATVLAMELARLRSLSEAELRLERDLVDALLDGTDNDTVQAMAQSLGYDLGRPQRAIVVEGGGDARDDDLLIHAVRRAARNLDLGTLIVARKGAVVVVASRDVPWEKFRRATLRELGNGRCRLGVGGRVNRPVDVARSHHEAILALRMVRSSGAVGVANFDDLGVYRLLSGIEDPGDVERFARERLGRLLDHDAERNSDLVHTLTQYLECGGSYERTAAILFVHRSTLKYRLQQIREITGYDLNDPDTRFNLHFSTRAWSTLLALQELRASPAIPVAPSAPPLRRRRAANATSAGR